MVSREEIKGKINAADTKECLSGIRAAGSLAEEGITLLIDLFHTRRKQNLPIDFIDGTTYQVLRQMNDQSLQIPMIEGLRLQERQIDYRELFDLLSLGAYQQADALTNKKMCEAAGEGALTRGWLYFTDVERIDLADLLTIDRLWLIFSEGKFGYSVQRRIWLNLGKNWEKLWQQIRWKQDGSFARYPSGFIWSLEAPRGHLPLSNQIRGNKTLEAIFNVLERADRA
ncbi:MAG: GUN4 N-terminal ARM-like repeat domain-containing protein [Pseudanabaenaceae cyanobacterium SKYGB_i_bin29]|nr:GUN4 domain-containing protein [Pseudanabaenaceae cyanobacterium SKYG29]MDW8421380.1 GUN4 N-terminal ARM-like repeat domain-containing protein [Pseudanabaenaceae cyanobacterium SKYGB_i_bin29]